MAAKAQILVEAVDMTRTAMQSVDRNLKSSQEAAHRLAQSFQSVIAATGALTFGRAMVDNAMQAEQASNRLDAVLRATGGSAGIAKTELDEMADSLAQLTQFDDESIRGAQATLLKFGNVAGDTFREGLKLAADYAAFMGTDVADAAQTVGKALSSPTEGLTALERQIGKIAPEQERMIKRFMEQGKVAEAQGVVLDILRGKIGGTADVMNTGLTGATKGVEKAWGELLETMGKTDAIGGRAERALKGLSSVLGDIRGELEGKDTPLSGLMDEFLKVAMQAGPFPVKLAAGAYLAGKATPADGDLNSARMQGVYANAYGGSNVTVGRGVVSKTKEQTDLAAKIAKEADEKQKWRLKMQLEGIEQWQADAKKINEEYGQYLSDQDKERVAGFARMRQELLESEAKYLLAEFEVREAMAQGESDAKIKRFANEAKILAAFRDEDLRGIEKAARKNEEAARDLGLTFTSAFEDAVIGGKELRDVMQGLAMDVGRIFMRKTVTEPVAAGLSGLLGKWMNGGSESPALPAGVGLEGMDSYHYGDYATGGSFRVGGNGGTDSQRVSFNASPDETVTISTPSQQRGGGGGNFALNQYITVGGNVTHADLIAVKQAAEQGAIAGVAQMARRDRGYRAALAGA